MFKFLRFILWTGFAVGLGIVLAKVEVDGRTPLEHLQHAWKRKVNPSKLDQLKDGLHDTLEGAKETLSEKPSKPERYSDDERSAIDRLIAKSQTKK